MVLLCLQKMRWRYSGFGGELRNDVGQVCIRHGTRAAAREDHRPGLPERPQDDREQQPHDERRGGRADRHADNQERECEEEPAGRPRASSCRAREVRLADHRPARPRRPARSATIRALACLRISWAIRMSQIRIPASRIAIVRAVIGCDHRSIAMLSSATQREAQRPRARSRIKSREYRRRRQREARRRGFRPDGREPLGSYASP